MPFTLHLFQDDGLEPLQISDIRMELNYFVKQRLRIGLLMLLEVIFRS